VEYCSPLSNEGNINRERELKYYFITLKYYYLMCIFWLENILLAKAREKSEKNPGPTKLDPDQVL
jgi:hypothetical protein